MQEGKAILIKDVDRWPTRVSMRGEECWSRRFVRPLCVLYRATTAGRWAWSSLTAHGQEGIQGGDLDLLAVLAVPVGVAVENHWL